MKIAVIIPTLNGGSAWRECVRSLNQQSGSLETLVIDSSSTDQTVKIALEAGFKVQRIDRLDFDHGATRNLGVSMLGDSVEVIVYMTQDAVLTSPDTIETLVRVFADDRIGAAYGRQIASDDATPLAAHARSFNYPAQSSTKGAEDLSEYGIKTVSLSNSFAAYRAKALQAVGGFPVEVINSEDVYVASKMIQHGYKIAYSAESVVRHAHNYNSFEVLRRYFDIGVFHAREPWIRDMCNGLTSEGAKYLVSEFRFIWNGNKMWIPKFLTDNLAKFCGYKLGLISHYLPGLLNVCLSRNKNYWQSSKMSSN